MLTTQADPKDLEKATSLALKYALESTELLKGQESRQAFKDFVDLVAGAHPIDRSPLSLVCCRLSADDSVESTILMLFKDHGTHAERS